MMRKQDVINHLADDPNVKVILLGEDHFSPASTLLNYGKNFLNDPKQANNIALVCESLNRKKNDAKYNIEEIMSSDLNTDSKYFCINCIKSGITIFGSESPLSKPKILVDECLKSKDSIETKLKKLKEILKPIIQYILKNKPDQESFINMMDDEKNNQNIENITIWAESILNEFANMPERLDHGDNSFAEVLIDKSSQFNKCILFACGADHIPGVDSILTKNKINTTTVIIHEKNDQNFLDSLNAKGIKFDTLLPLNQAEETAEDDFGKKRISLYYDCHNYIQKLQTQNQTFNLLSIFVPSKEETEVKIGKKLLSAIMDMKQAQLDKDEMSALKKNKNLQTIYDAFVSLLIQYQANPSFKPT